MRSCEILRQGTDVLHAGMVANGVPCGRMRHLVRARDARASMKVVYGTLPHAGRCGAVQ